MRAFKSAVTHVRHIELVVKGSEWQVIRVSVIFATVPRIGYTVPVLHGYFSPKIGTFLKAKYDFWFEILHKNQGACGT